MVHAVLSPSLTSHIATRRVEHLSGVSLILVGLLGKAATLLCSTEGRPRPGERRLCIKVRHGPGWVKTIPALTLAHEIMATKRGFSKPLKVTMFSLEEA